MPRRVGGMLRASFREQGALGAGLQPSGEGPIKELRCSALLTFSLSGLLSPVLTLGLFRLVSAPESGTGAR